MPTIFQLNNAVSSIEADSSVHAGNLNETGLWLRFALAAEELAGASSSANANVLGYMLRSAVALEVLSGTNGTAENISYEGYLKRIVDALEVQAGAVTTGSLGGRLVVAAGAAIYGAPSGTYTYENRVWANDGVWTWFNEPVAINSAGAAFVGSISSTGIPQLTGGTRATVSTIALAAAIGADDHNNPVPLILPDGRVSVHYENHATDFLMRHVVSVNALPNISTFGAERTHDAGGNVSYALTFTLSDGITRKYFRTTSGATGARKVLKAPAVDIAAGTEVWTTTTIFSASGERPYMTAIRSPGTDRIYFFMSTGHPNEGITSTRAVYSDLVGGVDKFYTLAGVEIVGLPINIATQGTLIHDGSVGGRVWNWDIQIGLDGHPRFLFTKYPSSTGARDIIFTDIEYWHARWTGSAVVENRLSTGQKSLYANENHYAPGMCFAGNDITTLYLAEQVGSYSEIKKYSFNEVTGVKTLVANVTSGSSFNNFRPESPSGSGPYEVFWIGNGPYTNYNIYSTKVMAAGFTTLATLSSLGGTFTLAENAALNDVAGAITGKTTGSTISLIDDALGRVAISGTNIVRGATALDFESAASHAFTIREYHPDAVTVDTALSLTVTDVAETFDPLTNLFGAAEKGGWYDPSALGTMSQTHDGVLGNVAIGDPVGRIEDQSGNGKHLLQTTAGSRPLLQQDGAGKYYLDFDGTDDFMSVAGMDLTGTDAVTLTAGLRKDSDAATGAVVEHSASSSANTGVFALFAPNGAAANFMFRHKGTLDSTATATGQTAPLTAVVTSYGDISTDTNIIRVNGTQVASSVQNQSAGNMTNQTMYVGARAGTSLRFNGRIYGLILRGAQSSAGDLNQTDTWMNGKTGAY